MVLSIFVDSSEARFINNLLLAAIRWPWRAALVKDDQILAATWLGTGRVYSP